ncbi:MAG: methyl-accepting chemotaxis protein [Pseudomonadota bacterium]
MKGMMKILERAGLISQDAPTEPRSAEFDIEQVHESAALAPVVAFDVLAGGTPLNLAEIYKNESVPPSAYPAERLLRLLNGLSAMDEVTRITAIKAMDEADESWTIADPVADANAKIRALVAHSQRIEWSLIQLETETLTQIDEVRARQEQATGSIRKQIADLEALAARELDRANKETAEHEGRLKAAKEQTTRELDEIKKTSTQLQNLAAVFGTLIPNSQG